MKVLITAGLFYPSKLGGPANTLYWLAKGLISKDIVVSVVASKNFIDKGLVETDKWSNVDGIRVRYCTAKTKLPFRVILHSCIELLKCDVVLLASLCYMPNFFIFLFALITRKKIIWSPRGELFDSALQGNKAKLFYFRLLKRLLKNRNTFHATSENEKLIIEKYFGLSSTIEVIPNYMELPVKMEKLNSGKQYLLYLGRITPIKALDNLILGLSLSKEFNNSNFKLLLAGIKQGDYYKKLEKIIEDNSSLKDKIEFIGSIEGEEKFKLYANAYFTLLVSHSENFGNVVIESLSQGTPVIASKGTPWQILKKYNAGYWIDNSPKNIASVIDKILLLNSDDYSQKVNNAYKLAIKFDIYNNIENWIKILQ